MSPLEVLWRVWRLTRVWVGALLPRQNAHIRNHEDIWNGPCNVKELRHRLLKFPYCPSSTDMKEWPDKWRDQCLIDAKSGLSHQVSFFMLDNHPLGQKIDWHCDYASGVKVPQSYAGKLDYRNSNVVGDVKVIWELSRMQHLTRLAQAWCWTDDQRYPKEVVSQVTDWIKSNPWMIGINWTSPMECALRLVTWTWAFHLIRNWDGLTDDFCKLLVVSVHQHIRTIDSSYSLFSSANNHLIAEASGVYIASAYWSELKGAAQWRRRAKSHLVRECLRQNTTDGVNVEHSFHYAFFVWDLLLYPALMGQARGDHFPTIYWNRLERIAEFMAWVSDGKGNTPNTGDQDDGQVLKLSDNNNLPIMDMMALAGGVFNRLDFQCLGKAWANEKAAWILGKIQKTQTKTIHARACRAFMEGGYHVLRSGDSSGREVMILFDVAPNGDSLTGAHGHADALSINLHLDGQPFLSDPGTFSYQDTLHRKYFRATAQHSTLCFDNDDQSEYINRFLWGKREKTKLIKCQMTDKGGAVTGGVQWWTGDYHERQVVCEFSRSCIILRDKWKGKKTAKLNYIIAPGVKVIASKYGVCKLIGEYASLEIKCDIGDIEIMETVYSSRCYKKEASYRIVVNLPGNSGEVVTSCTWVWYN